MSKVAVNEGTPLMGVLLMLGSDGVKTAVFCGPDISNVITAPSGAVVPSSFFL